MQRIKVRWVVLGFVATSLVTVSCTTIDAVTGAKTRNMYAIQEDIDLGTSVLKEVEEEMAKGGARVLTNTERGREIQDMVSRITAVSHMPDLPYEVVVFKTNLVNAAAAPGGKIMVFSGLYDSDEKIVYDDDELAAVLGHEIAHVTCRHTTESMTRAAPVNALLLVGAIYAETQGNDDVAAALGAGFLVYQGLLLPKFSRTDEAEADSVGIMYMAKAGYDPRAAPRLWKRVHEKEGSSALLTLFSTHPSNKYRWEALEKLVPQAMEEYARAKGGYPSDYKPPAIPPAVWRRSMDARMASTYRPRP
jgi:predicted Zn-dependent protease